MNSKRKGIKKSSGENSEHVKKRSKFFDVKINSALQDSVLDFRKSWEQKTEFKNDSKDGYDIELYNTPFQLCVIHNLIQDGSATFLDDLKDELSDLTYQTKNNDLYQFHQSQDLAEVDSSAVNAIRELLYKDVVGWVREATGLELTDKVDVTCSRYDHTDVLLCHDDQTDTRKVAYILYLTKNWSKTDGGTLDMFDRDGNEQPCSVVRSIVPQWNSLAFFEVTDKSFHQVSEILTEDKTRVALSGWFHAPNAQAPSTYHEQPPVYVAPLDSDEDLAQWVNISYLMDETHRDINTFFEENSEIRLTKFFVSEKFSELNEALESPSINWQRRGPANRRCYDVATPPTDGSSPSCVWSLLELLQSQQMFALLAAMTDLELADLEAETDDGARCHAELQRWTPGSYTLAHDVSEPQVNTLEFLVHVGCEELPADAGGFISFIAKDDDDELLTVHPTANSVALTYKDKDTLSFVKYVNLRCKKPFYTFAVTYCEKPSAS